MKVIVDGCYLKVVVTENEFNNIPDDFLISGCTDKVKYMCANQTEINYLSKLGNCDLSGFWVDYFEIVKEVGSD